MITIVCPKCQAQSRFSITEPRFEGPFRCYKCHSFMKIRVAYDALVSNEIITEEEAKKIQELKSLKDRFAKKEED